MLKKVRAERSVSISGDGIFRNTDQRREHAARRQNAVPSRIEREGKDAVRRELVCQRRNGGQIGLERIESRARPDRHHDFAAAGRDGLNGQRVEIAPVDPERGAEAIDHSVFENGSELERALRHRDAVTIGAAADLERDLRAPGTRIVAHEYGFSDWKPDRHVRISKNFYLYVVPAQVGGTWRLTTELPDGAREYDLRLTQRYQEVRGGVTVAGGYLPAFEPRLTGTRIEFVLIDDNVSYRYEGRVSTHLMEGTVRWGLGPNQQNGTWRATRAESLPEG